MKKKVKGIIFNWCANLPTVSKLGEFDKTLFIGTTPCEGRNASIPQKEAGILMQPTVSVPIILHNKKLLYY